MIDSFTCEFAQIDGGHFESRMLYYGPGPTADALKFAKQELTEIRWSTCKMSGAAPMFLVRAGPGSSIQVIACCPRCSSASLIPQLVRG